MSNNSWARDFEAYGFARQGYLAVNFKPMLFVQRRNLAHSSALGILNPRLFLKGGIDFQKAVINRLIVSVEQHFDCAKAFVNRRSMRYFSCDLRNASFACSRSISSAACRA